MNTSKAPEILAPAGDRHAFLAALAAGADAVYVGLKHFSARMQAGNFSISELAALTELAHERGSRVYVAFNSLVKPADVRPAGRLVDRLARYVNPDALIVQDMALPALARQAGYQGELHLSTLANVSHPLPLETIRDRFGISRVVLPRELNVDEVRSCAEACPEGMEAEVFVHGALCYNVSGRCYWSSFMGGKSGLRGRCVQPCRREYEQKGRRERFFSCNDLGLDMLVKPLLSMPKVSAWKIEGRKKGPHYVFYTVTAYRMLRDGIDDPAMKKTAMELLDQALGRKNTHYSFLPQRTQHPVETGGQTGSGLLVAHLKSPQGRKFQISPRLPLLPGDLLRVGYEDEPWHQTVKVNKNVPKGGGFTASSQRKPPRKGTPVFLVDRREPELTKQLVALEKQFENRPSPGAGPSDFAPDMPQADTPARSRARTVVMNLNRRPPKGLPRSVSSAVWLSPKSLFSGAGNHWWWLPPVIWPDEERMWADTIAKARRGGAWRFVLGAPWQAAFFADTVETAKPAAPRHKDKGRKNQPPRRRPPMLWAGPFCNVSNALAVQAMADLGMSGAIVSPELAREDALALPEHSPLPLGFVTWGMWPLGITRIDVGEIKPEKPLRSPKGEVCFTRRYGPNNWVYPNWGIDLRDKENELLSAGYSTFVHIFENVPRDVQKANRTSTFNWDLNLL